MATDTRALNCIRFCAFYLKSQRLIKNVFRMISLNLIWFIKDSYTAYCFLVKRDILQ